MYGYNREEDNKNLLRDWIIREDSSLSSREVEKAVVIAQKAWGGTVGLGSAATTGIESVKALR